MPHQRVFGFWSCGSVHLTAEMSHFAKKAVVGYWTDASTERKRNKSRTVNTPATIQKGHHTRPVSYLSSDVDLPWDKTRFTRMVEKPADVAHFGAIDAIFGSFDQICSNYTLCRPFRFKRAHFMARQILSSIRNYKLALADVHHRVHAPTFAFVPPQLQLFLQT